MLRKRDFDGVFKKPARSSDHFFTILFSQGSTTQPRMGLAIAKKAAKRAVDRNRIKRLCRESFRQQDNLPVVDLVVMTRASAVSATNAELFSALDKHWQRIRRKHKSHV